MWTIVHLSFNGFSFILVDWLIEFYDMSTLQELFYAKRLKKKRSFYVHIYIFVVFLK